MTESAITFAVLCAEHRTLRIGLDHVALACEDESELARVAAALSAAGVENTGAKLNETLGKRYVAFKDPDGIAWEFYMA